MKRFNLFHLIIILLSSLFITSSVSAETKEQSQVEKNIKFRKDFGLEMKSEGALLSKNLTSIEKYGVELTEEEEKEIDRRVSIQQKKVPEIKELLTNQNVEIAGIFIDQTQNGKVFIGLDEKQTPNIQKVKIMIKEYSTKNSMEVEFFYPKYTEKYLDELLVKIFNQREELESMNVHISTIDTSFRDQKVVIALEKLDDETSKIIYKLFKDEPISLIQGESPEFLSAPKGGERIYNNRTGCSAGYYAKNRSGQNFLITAGHCGRIQNSNGTGTYLAGEGWYYNNSYIGHASSNVYGFYGMLDAMGIAVDSSLSNSIININGGLRVLKSAQDSSNDYEGQLVCKTGNTTQSTCGKLISRNVSFTDRLTGTPFFNLRGTNVHADYGDSGGTVYVNYQLLGIVSMGKVLGYTMLYPHVENINNQFGLTPIFK